MSIIPGFRAVFLVAAIGAAAACATPTTTRLADGTLVYAIDCDGGAGGLNYCFGRAGKTCGAEGFTVVDSYGNVLAVSDVASGDVQTIENLHSFDQNRMLVKCGS